MHAAQRGNSEIIKLLLNSQAIIGARDKVKQKRGLIDWLVLNATPSILVYHSGSKRRNYDASIIGWSIHGHVESHARYGYVANISAHGYNFCTINFVMKWYGLVQRPTYFYAFDFLCTGWGHSTHVRCRRAKEWSYLFVAEKQSKFTRKKQGGAKLEIHIFNWQYEDFLARIDSFDHFAQDGETALMHGAAKGSSDVINALLDSKAKIDARNKVSTYTTYTTPLCLGPWSCSALCFGGNIIITFENDTHRVIINRLAIRQLSSRSEQVTITRLRSCLKATRTLIPKTRCQCVGIICLVQTKRSA